MKPIIHRLQQLTARTPACLAAVAAVLVAGCASEPRPMVVGVTPTLPAINEYCANAQKEVAASRVPARNVMMTDYQAFSRASPSVKPLETMQFTVFADDNRTRPRMISCKLHSSARIRAEYGATAAGEPSSCARLNRRTLDAVMASLTEKQKKKMPFKGPVPVMLDPDLQAANESEWLEGFTMAHTDAGGTLRIRAKSFGAAAGPVRTGTRAAGNGNGNRVYCHLIAPDYLKRILIGEVKLPAGEFAESKRTASR
jgi:hypothetical protein